ncbi:MAG: DUF1127 domain-containing protein [Cognatishimia sp.]|uniref:DUF1127 domain-containing protein n=1 Tax=Cognatishimia sp. TaxID=2211648 RepID=UPI003B8D80FA
MAALDTARVQTVSNGQIGLFLNAAFARVQHWFEARKTRIVLSKLTDRELEDIGLLRRDIHSIT